jgi:hypothetical protein
VLSVLKMVQCTQVHCGQKVGFLNVELVVSAVTIMLGIVLYCIVFATIFLPWISEYFY